MKTNLSLLSMFAGMGGWEAKFGHHLKIEGVYELNPDACKIYQANYQLGWDKIHCQNVKEVNYRKYEGIDLVTASPPCQEYSSAKRTGKRNDDRANAGLALVKVLQQARPQTLLIENVPQYAKSGVFEEIVRVARSLGYYANYQVINAADYGIPQSRKRLFCVISRRPYVFPLPFYPKISWYDAIADLFVSNELGKTFCTKTQQWGYESKQLREVKLSDRDWEKYGEWLKINESGLLDHDGAGKSNKPRDICSPCKTIRKLGGDRHCWQFTAVLYNRKDSKTPFRDPICPAPTLLRSHHKDPPKIIRENFHAFRINKWAAARLQSFPDSFILPQCNVQAWERVGNSVSPLLVYRLFGDFLFHENENTYHKKQLEVYQSQQ